MKPVSDLIDFWLGKFHEEGEKIIPFFVNCQLPRTIFLSRYKSLPPIEEMPEKEKKEMKAYVLAMFPEKSIEEKLIACKIIYTVGTLL